MDNIDTDENSHKLLQLIAIFKKYAVASLAAFLLFSCAMGKPPEKRDENQSSFQACTTHITAFPNWFRFMVINPADKLIHAASAIEGCLKYFTILADIFCSILMWLVTVLLSSFIFLLGAALRTPDLRSASRYSSGLSSGEYEGR